MKSLFTLLLLCLLYNNSNAQNSTPLYQHDFGFYERMLDKKNSMYEGGFNKVQTDYSFLMNLRLFNKENLVVLNACRDYTKSQLKNSSQIDFSLNQNVEAALNVINVYIGIKTIMDELKMLNIIGKEILNLKVVYPGSFTSTDRYKELIALISEIENCHAEQISSLALKHGIF